MLTVLALALPVSAGLFGWGIKYAFVGGFVIALRMLWGSNLKRDLLDKALRRPVPGVGYWLIAAPIGLMIGTVAGCSLSVPIYLAVAWATGHL